MDPRHCFKEALTIWCRESKELEQQRHSHTECRQTPLCKIIFQLSFAHESSDFIIVAFRSKVFSLFNAVSVDIDDSSCFDDNSFEASCLRVSVGKTCFLGFLRGRRGSDDRLIRLFLLRQTTAGEADIYKNIQAKQRINTSIGEKKQRAFKT
jgi:hypothetical protein